MLYDPKWEKPPTKAKVDPLTLKALIAWLEKQPATKAYCYQNSGTCLAAQYNASIGREYRVVAFRGVCLFPRRTSFDQQLENIAVAGHTFGEALARARRMVDKEGRGHRGNS